jgi:hypothetical protein
MFPKDNNNNNNPILLKKMKKGESQLSMWKTLLGFEFDGKKKTMCLENETREKLLKTLHDWLGSSQRWHVGIPFDEFQLVISKIRHVFMAIPAGDGLMSPCNSILWLQPWHVYLHNNEDLWATIEEIQTLLQQLAIKLTRCCELVTGWPDFVGVKDASCHGIGGIVIGELSTCTPTVYHFAWPDDVTKAIKSQTNPSGTITKSDLEMDGLLMLFIIMEHVCRPLVEKLVALFSNNSPTIGWVERLASRQLIIEDHLIRALALWLKANKCCPLTPQHINGIKNAMTNIPSRLFGSIP